MSQSRLKERGSPAELAGAESGEPVEARLARLEEKLDQGWVGQPFHRQ